MPGTPTTRFAIPTLAGTDLISDIDTNVNAGLSAVDSKMTGWGTGLLSARPTSTGGSPGVAGRIYRATDTGQVFIDTGTSWDQIIPDGDGVWHPLFTASGLLLNHTAGTYLLNGSTASDITASPAINQNSPLWTPGAVSDYAVSGKTTQLRLVSVMLVNGTAIPAATFTAQLRPLTGVGGGSGALQITSLGSAEVSGSAHSNPGASSRTRQSGSDTAVSALTADVAHALCVAVTGSMPVNATAQFRAVLEMRHT